MPSMLVIGSYQEVMVVLFVCGNPLGTDDAIIKVNRAASLAVGACNVICVVSDAPNRILFRFGDRGANLRSAKNLFAVLPDDDFAAATGVYSIVGFHMDPTSDGQRNRSGLVDPTRFVNDAVKVELHFL